MKDTVSRLSALAIVVVLHVAVLSVRWRLDVPIRMEPRASIWIDIRRNADAPPLPPLPVPSVLAPNLELAVSPPGAPASDSESVSSVVAAPPTDWRASMEAAAGAVVAQIIRQEAYRPLGPIKRNAAGSSAPTSIFEQPPRKAGDIDDDSVQGRTQVWHGENCYTELSLPTVSMPALNDSATDKNQPNLPRCVVRFGEQHARGDLLNDLKKR